METASDNHSRIFTTLPQNYFSLRGIFTLAQKPGYTKAKKLFGKIIAITLSGFWNLQLQVLLLVVAVK